MRGLTAYLVHVEMILRRLAAGARPGQVSQGAIWCRMKNPILAAAVFLLAAAALIFSIAFRGTDTPVAEHQSTPGDNQQLIEADQPANSVRTSSEPTFKGMVFLPGGRFTMGALDSAPDEFPPHEVELDGFWIDTHEVTNSQFAEFVKATGYVTTAEQPPELRALQPGVNREEIKILPELNQPGSICSYLLGSRKDIDPEKGAYSWWQYVPGANWRHPEGPESSIDDRMDHPVVHVSWLDAMAYCKWANKELPTEAQWEYAARGGLNDQSYPWGDQRNPGGQWLHNIWQGEFPISNTADDGFLQTAPVGSFPANNFGLFDVSGNVWEWCRDYYQPEYYSSSPRSNPTGPDSSFDPMDPAVIKRVQRGGSFMCSEQYCIGYRTTARMKGEEDTGAFHTGFRCVINKPFDGSPDHGTSPTSK